VNIDIKSPKKLASLSLQKLYTTLLKKTLNTTALLTDADVDVWITHQANVKKLNAQYRDKNMSTDVLSFPLWNRQDFGNMQTAHLGQIVISYPHAFRQAKRYHHTILREFSFLFVHGVLHLLGYDHLQKKDEAIMVQLQDSILGKRVTL
jgi:probable rRNA maturation factor